MALTEADAAAKEFVDVRTVYNFINVPIGATTSISSVEGSDQATFAAPLQTDTEG
jgi:hypothetical protein